MAISMISVKLSTQRALLQYVPSTLRAVFVSAVENVIGVRFFFDGEISEDHREVMEVVLTEIMCDFHLDDKGREIDFDYEAIRCDFPQKPPHLSNEQCVYFRYEPQGEVVDETHLALHYPNDRDVDDTLTKMAAVKLSAQRALLGCVRPNLRGVTVQVFDNGIQVRFFFDGEATEDDLKIAKAVITKMKDDLRHDDKLVKDEITYEAMRCDFPQRPPYLEEEYGVYFRYEDDMYPKTS